MKNIDSSSHLKGESIYLDDIPVAQGTLYGAVYDSPIAHGILEKLDITEALKTEGLIRIFTAKDIPGINQIGGILPDEPLFAEEQVHFCGMPIAFVVADSQEAAYAAVKKIKALIQPLPVVTDPREAYSKNELILPPRTFKKGNSEAAWQNCSHIFSGRADSNGQEHLYIETQGAYCLPTENGHLKVFSSTQGPTAVQRTIANVLGIAMHQIEVDVTRLGGGFGGKEDQATPWAVMCALASFHLRKPVKYSLHRMEDMRMTGKRHPYSSDFKIGLDADYNIQAYEVSFFQNAGAAADLSPAVLERTLFHCTNSYFIPNVTATAYSCRTHLPPNTAFRGFGGPQGMFVIESAIAHAAEQLGISAARIQEKNLLKTGDEFPYGQKAVSAAYECWKTADEKFNLSAKLNAVHQFNQENQQYKKGLSLMPICFGISFTKTLMNQARALVHVYTDGSIGVSTGAVEMGQGVNTKIAQVVAREFSMDPALVKIHTTNTFRIANTSPSAASATADLNGKAAQLACKEIKERLLEFAAHELHASLENLQLSEGELLFKGKNCGWNWKKLIQEAFVRRINLSAHAHYSTPEIHFDSKQEKGHPFAYHVYGTAITTVTVDCLRGTYTFDCVEVVHDIGSGMHEQIDRGQCEGGIVQGIGWMTMEEIIYDKEGKLKSNALSTYKVPDLYSAPKSIAIHFLESSMDNLALLRSKAVGEPPLMYGIGAYFALRNAVKAFNPKAKLAFDAPMTPEKVLMGLFS